MNRPLQLQRPLAVLDTETTGVDTATARIVELAITKLAPNGSRTDFRWLLNPGVPIPAEATALHGISDADVAGERSFAAVAGEIAFVLRGADLGGFNVRKFDIPLLQAEFARAGAPWPCEGVRIVDAMAIFHERERRDLSAAVRLYLGREHEGAHGAVADVAATIDVLLAQLDRYTDLPTDVAGLDLASGGRQPDWATECGRIRWNAAGEAVFAFGKNAGVPVARADRGFLRWVLEKDFPADVKEIVSAVVGGRVVRRPS